MSIIKVNYGDLPSGGDGYQGSYFEIDITGANTQNTDNPIITGLSEINKLCIWWDYEDVSSAPCHGAMLYDKNVSTTKHMTMAYQNASSVQGLLVNIGDTTNNYASKIISITDGNIILKNGTNYTGTRHYRIFVE